LPVLYGHFWESFIQTRVSRRDYDGNGPVDANTTRPCNQANARSIIAAKLGVFPTRRQETKRVEIKHMFAGRSIKADNNYSTGSASNSLWHCQV
ncbi:hypothetical protein BaRGS_00005257, partial [Batillaria attramentaria]